MRTLDKEKITKLHNVSKELAQEHGVSGTPEREEFNSKATAWYYGEILRERRKELKLTQQELADKVGKARAWVAKIEKGETDLQLSSFLQLSAALGFKFTLGV